MAIKLKKAEVKPTAKTLKIKEISEIINQAEILKQDLIRLLLSFVPDSLPIHFQNHLKSIVSALISKGHYVWEYTAKDFGFTNDSHFVQQMELLQKAWKGIIQMKASEPINKQHSIILEFCITR